MASGAGCGCKLGKDLLLEALGAMPAVPADARILVGAGALDDGCVYRLGDDLALVASIDFSTPMVDDPGTFGAIAAVNALSDLHAMGATPTLALAVCAYPGHADREALAAILAGGAAAALAEGCPVLGGHSVDDPEPKYGLAVVGTAHPDRLLTNAAGRPGDVLVLTKPVGVGVAIAAARAGAAPEATTAAAEASMLASNRAASAAALACGVRAATDVSGFGLLGHLGEMAAASGAGAVLDASAVPLLPAVEGLAAAGHVPGGLRRNRDFARRFARLGAGLPAHLELLICDPQTSGGLLLAVPPGSVGALVAALERDRVTGVAVGRLTDGPAGEVVVDPALSRAAAGP